MSAETAAAPVTLHRMLPPEEAARAEHERQAAANRPPETRE